MIETLFQSFDVLTIWLMEIGRELTFCYSLKCIYGSYYSICMAKHIEREARIIWQNILRGRREASTSIEREARIEDFFDFF